MGDMNKYSCIKYSGSVFFYATLIAEDDKQARDMCVIEINKKLSGSGGEPRDWSARVLEADVEGPARTLDCGHRNA
jgi:hypothetical protein